MMRSTWLLAALLCAAGSEVLADPAATFQAPEEASIPDNAFGDQVRQGKALFMETSKLAPEYVGNSLKCVNCHLDRGRLANSSPLWGAYPAYPAFRAKNNKVNSFAERLQGCFEFSMNGKAPPSDSPELKALTVYAYWMAKNAPTGVSLPGRGYPEVPQPREGYDIARGGQLYAQQCAICHGAQGEGQLAHGEQVFPALWGANSYNWGAGMHRINTAAAFIKQSMPLGKGLSLSDQQAWDVAAYINSHERPQDPRLVDGSVEQTRLRFHAHDGVNLYGQTVNGVLLGQGTQGRD
ncbi:MAG: Thiosulfate dehydrogenase [Stenotrophomonas maltophilia]|nr:MAG: Thiosulfate dehydrogenase [Stenotrophomonas maltophilia]